MAPDTVSPVIRFVFPLGESYDRDGDGLVDLEVAFEEDPSGIDASRVSLVSDRGISGGISAANLLDVWHVERLDSSGFVVEETVDHLLPRGNVRLQVTVLDSAGNRATGSTELTLPPAALHQVVDLDARTYASTQVLVRPDGQRVYVTTEEPGGSAISVVDARTFQRIKTERTPLPGLSGMAWDARRNRLYAMSIDEPYLAVFDGATETFGPWIQTSARGIAVATSSRRDRVYVGLEAWGLISVVDPALGVQEGLIDLKLENTGNLGDNRLGMTSFSFDSGEDFLYTATRVDTQQGLLVVNPDDGTLVAQVDLWPEWTGLGGGQGLTRDGETLAVATETPNGTGRIAQLPLADPERERFGETGRFVGPMQVAVAQAGREYALVTGDGGIGYWTIMLMDATTLRVVWEERFTQEVGMRQDIEFRPDGNVFFVVGTRNNIDFDAEPNELSVYLYRK